MRNLFICLASFVILALASCSSNDDPKEETYGDSSITITSQYLSGNWSIEPTTVTGNYFQGVTVEGYMNFTVSGTFVAGLYTDNDDDDIGGTYTIQKNKILLFDEDTKLSVGSIILKQKDSNSMEGKANFIDGTLNYTFYFTATKKK